MSRKAFPETALPDARRGSTVNPRITGRKKAFVVCAGVKGIRCEDLSKQAKKTAKSRVEDSEERRLNDPPAGSPSSSLAGTFAGRAWGTA
jgi:hypothetical protein